MIDERTKMLIATLKKLYHRDAKHNIQRILTKTHEADIAAILEGFDLDQRFDLFRMEPSLAKQSGILSHLKPELQKEILSCLSHQQILKLVGLMDTDDAADLLGLLPEENAKAILSAMGKEDSDEVADLMGYPEDSAGGIMSSDFLALNQDLTVDEAIKSIRSEEDDIGVAFYVYVINENQQLVGVVSLKQLLLSKRSETLKDLMFTEVISVSVDTSQEKVAKAVEHYDFLSIPVVDQSNKLVGVVTVDDILDVIREEAEENLLAMGQAGLGTEATTYERLRARLGWLFFAFFGGLLCFAIVFLFGQTGDSDLGPQAFWVIAAYIPLLLSVGATTGSQAATVTVGAIRGGKLENFKVREHLWTEFKLSLLFMLCFGFFVFILSKFVIGQYNLDVLLPLAMALQILISMLLGNVIPIVVGKLGIDPSVASIPIYATFADVSAVAVLFVLYHFVYLS